MAGRGISGVALAALGAGFVVLWSGIKGKSISQSVQYIIQGKNPGGSPTANPIGGTTTAAAPVNVTGAETNISGGSAQALLQTAAAQHGWGSGAEWQALQNVEMAEAGYNATIANPTSGALGIAQALGHGNANTAGTLGNQYGGYGLTDAEARAANSGSAGEQAVWMVNYIASRWGTPSAAWANEQANHWY